jgi:hypothetical protein
LANALMKAETKAKRRVTLSIAGLGWLDETELETIPQARATIVTTSDQHGNTSVEDIVTNIVTPVTSIPSPVQHPTSDEITTLVECARSANVDLEAFGHDMRRLMQLP